MKHLLWIGLLISSSAYSQGREWMRERAVFELIDLRSRPAAGQDSMCRQDRNVCVWIRYTPDGAGRRQRLARPLCAASQRQLAGKYVYLLRSQACGASTIRTRFTRTPPPYFLDYLQPEGLGVGIHRLINGQDSWPDDVCWEVDVNGGYDYAQLVRDRSVCGPLAAAERGRVRRNDDDRRPEESYEDGALRSRGGRAGLE